MREPGPPKWSVSQDSLGAHSTAESGAQLVHPEKDYLCGIFSFRPAWLQRFATPRWYFVNYVLMGILSGAYKTYLVGTLSTIERRFQMSNSTTAVILLADNISPIFINVIAGYYANRISRPKLMSLGSFIVVLSCIFSVLPFAIYGPGLTDEDMAMARASQKLRVCHDRSLGGYRADNCSGDKAGTSWIPFLLFFFANFLNGSGGSVYFVVGSTYMDDNIRKKNSPFYFSVSFALRLLGPVLGFLTSGFCLSLHENISYGAPMGLSKKDPRWIGAWWLGYIFFGIALTLIAIPMMFFPRILPMGRDEKANRIISRRASASAAKDMWRSVLRLAKNPIFTLKSIGFVFIIMAAAGYGTTFTKYLEHQFGRTASSASFLSGTSKVLTNMLGIMAGGLIIQFFKPSARKVAIYVAFIEAVYMLGYVALFFIGCPSKTIYGLTDYTGPYNGNPIDYHDAAASLSNSCNADCGCSINDFSPVCSSVGTLFSPCYAGCKDQELSLKGSVLSYGNCTCVGSYPQTIPETVQPGYCGSTCSTLTLYLAIIIVGQLIGSSARPGSMLMYLRCVDPADKSFALGAGTSFINLVGFIPYPLIYGYVLDKSCILWGKKCDGSRGSCKLYDIDKMRYLVHGTTVGLLLIGVICYSMVIFYAHRIKHFYSEPDDGDQDDAKKNNGQSVTKNGVVTDTNL